jgi:hypothetical protein
MYIQLSDNQISAIIGGALGIAGAIIGFFCTALQATISRLWRRRGLRKMLGHEVSINIRELSKWEPPSALPVRSNYLWQALRGEVPGLLPHIEVVALSEFYYGQAEVYKNEAPKPKDVCLLITRANEALQLLGCPPPDTGMYATADTMALISSKGSSGG